jgi:hypothetical protein
MKNKEHIVYAIYSDGKITFRINLSHEGALEEIHDIQEDSARFNCNDTRNYEVKKVKIIEME